MNSTAFRPLLVTIALLAATGCGNSNDTASPDASATPAPATRSDTVAIAGLPDMPECFRKNLARAFETASEGRSPTMACTSVVARAAGHPLPDGATPSPESVRAFELCYIDIAARYIDTLLAQITSASTGDATDDVCARIASYAVISRTSLGSFAGNIGLDRDTLDTRLLERVNSAMGNKCPDQIEALTGYR